MIDKSSLAAMQIKSVDTGSRSLYEGLPIHTSAEFPLLMASSVFISATEQPEPEEPEPVPQLAGGRLIVR